MPEPTTTLEQELLRRINEVRAAGHPCDGTEPRSTGLQALLRNPALTRTAQLYSAEIAASGVFSHEDLRGRRPGTRARDSGYTGRQVVENLAWGQASPEDVINAWLGSRSHCEAIMSQFHVEAGVGYSLGSAGKPIWVFVAGAGE